MTDAAAAPQPEPPYSEPSPNYNPGTDVIAKPEPPADLVERARKWWGLSDYSSSAYNEYEQMLVIMAAFAQEHAAAEKARAGKAEAEYEDMAHTIGKLGEDLAEYRTLAHKLADRGTLQALKDANDRAEAAEKALADEREACAQIVEKHAPASQDMTSTMIAEALDAAAAAIRARKGGGDE